MFSQIFAAIIFDALILCGALYLLAKHEADYSFPKCAMVVAPIVVAPLVIAAVLAEHLPPLTVLILVPLLLVPFAIYMVVKFCWVPASKAILVVAVFYVGHFAMNMGIAAARREFQKPVKRVEPKQSAQTSTKAGETRSPRQETRPAQTNHQSTEPQQTRPPREALLAEASASMARRLSVHDQLGAIAEAAKDAKDVVVDSVSFRCTSSRSEWQATLKLSIRLPADGEQAVNRLLNQIKSDSAFKPPWQVAVVAFSADTSPGASLKARTAVVECKFRALCRQPAEADKTSYSDKDVQRVLSTVLTPRLGNYLLSATERVEKAAAAASLRVESVKEIGEFATPGGNGTPAMRTYAVRATGPWAPDAVARFVGVIEKDALLQIQALDIKAQARAGKAEARLDIGWPIWIAPEKAKAVFQGEQLK